MTDLAVWVFAGLCVVGLCVAGWFALTHSCAREHTEQRMSCSTISTHVGGGLSVGSTDCAPYTATVCDEWVRKP